MIKGIDISEYQQKVDFKKVKKSGIEFVIIRAGFGKVANPDWFTNRLDLERLKGFDKWLAHWVSVPKWKNEFGGLWQYGLTRVDGYNGDIDGDYSYRDYEKTIKELGLNGFEKDSKKSAEVKITIGGKTYTGILAEQ